MESESQLAERVENTLTIDSNLALDIPIRNEADIAPIEHEASKEHITQLTSAGIPPIRKRQINCDDKSLPIVSQRRRSTSAAHVVSRAYLR